MHINFPMWRKASWQLIKMDDKKEWDALDVVSKWLIATRSAVTLVTVYSCVIAGLLAWRDGNFSWVPFIILTLGLFIAHGTNNLLNDYTDYSRGLDKDNYFRTQYGVHPLAQGFFTKSQQISWFIVSGVLATLAGVYALIKTNFNPVVIGLFLFGAVVLLLYTYPFKYWGLGELAIFLIWGPIMVGGVYFTMALITNGGDPVISGMWSWPAFPMAWVLPASTLASTSTSVMMTRPGALARSRCVWVKSLARRVDQIVHHPHLCDHCLPGLRAALFHPRHADRLPGLQACPHSAQDAE